MVSSGTSTGYFLLDDKSFKEREMNYMPRRDGSGPMGMGPMTGRGAGYCNPSMYRVNNRANFVAYGLGRGYRRQYNVIGAPDYMRNDYIQYNTIDEKSFLSQKKIDLENQLKQISGRLFEIDKEEE